LYLEVVRYLTNVVEVQVLQYLDLAIAVDLSGRLLSGRRTALTVIAGLVAV
jgi:hypothetical protein